MVWSEETAPEEGATAACSRPAVSPAKPLFQNAEDDPTGGERDTAGRQAALQSVLCAAASPVGERATSKGFASTKSAVDAAVVPCAVSGADAPLTSDVQAAAAAELRRASVEQEEQAAAQAALSAAMAAQLVAQTAAAQATVQAADAAPREAQAALPVSTAGCEVEREATAGGQVVAQHAAQRSQTAQAKQAEQAELAEPAPAVETPAEASEAEAEADADASQSQGGDQKTEAEAEAEAEAEGGSSSAAPSGEDPLSAPPLPKAKKPKAKKQGAKQ